MPLVAIVVAAVTSSHFKTVLFKERRKNILKAVFRMTSPGCVLLAFDK